MSGAPVHVVEDKASSIAQGSCQAPVVGSATGNAAAERLGSGAAGAAASIRDDALLGSSMRAGAGSFTKCTNYNDDANDGGDTAASPTSSGASPEQAAFDYLYDSSVAKRYALNTVQPTIVHNYSDVGYALMPLPAPTFKWLKAWYEGHAHEEIKESSAGAVGTQHKAPWYVRHIHYPLKTKLIRELLPLLAEWSGYRAEALQMTSIYGIRRYSRGSVLRMHVDTTVTHVVSAIVNVAQDGMEKDWPLEIKGNDGLYHYVNMKPGEVLIFNIIHSHSPRLSASHITLYFFSVSKVYLSVPFIISNFTSFAHASIWLAQSHRCCFTSRPNACTGGLSHSRAKATPTFSSTFSLPTRAIGNTTGIEPSEF